MAPKTSQKKTEADPKYCPVCDLEFAAHEDTCLQCHGDLVGKAHGVPPEELRARRDRGREDFVPDGTTKAIGLEEEEGNNGEPHPSV